MLLMTRGSSLSAHIRFSVAKSWRTFPSVNGVFRFERTTDDDEDDEIGGVVIGTIEVAFEGATGGVTVGSEAVGADTGGGGGVSRGETGMSNLSG